MILLGMNSLWNMRFGASVRLEGVVLPEDTLPPFFSLPVSSADPLSFNELMVSALKSHVDTIRPDLFDSLVSCTMKGADLGLIVEPFYRKKLFKSQYSKQKLSCPAWNRPAHQSAPTSPSSLWLKTTLLTPWWHLPQPLEG